MGESKDLFVGKWTGGLAHFDGDIPIEVVVEKNLYSTVRIANGVSRNLENEGIRGEGECCSGHSCVFT